MSSRRADVERWRGDWRVPHPPSPSPRICTDGTRRHASLFCVIFRVNREICTHGQTNSHARARAHTNTHYRVYGPCHLSSTQSFYSILGSSGPLDAPPASRCHFGVGSSSSRGLPSGRAQPPREQPHPAPRRRREGRDSGDRIRATAAVAAAAQGYAGLGGKAGGVGTPGRQGPPGKDGVGPPAARAVLTGGKFPEGQCYGSTPACAALGVRDNLCGACTPLCARCGAEAGFRLANPAGLRWRAASFDAGAAGAGSIAVRNICALARHGNGGLAGAAPAAAAAGSFATAAPDAAPQQPRWFSACEEGSAVDAACCINARAVLPGFDWARFSVGGRCGGDATVGPVTASLDCVLDPAALAAARTPLAAVAAPAALRSDAAEAAGTSLQGANAMCRATLEPSGDLTLYLKGDSGRFSPGPGGATLQWAARGLPGGGASYGPFVLGMGADGGWAVRNKDGEAVWATGTTNPAGTDRLEVTDGCKLCVVGPGGARRRCSCEVEGEYRFADGACLA
jgi:hypothetical protein